MLHPQMAKNFKMLHPQMAECNGRINLHYSSYDSGKEGLVCSKNSRKWCLPRPNNIIQKLSSIPPHKVQSACGNSTCFQAHLWWHLWCWYTRRTLAILGQVTRCLSWPNNIIQQVHNILHVTCDWHIKKFYVLSSTFVMTFVVLVHTENTCYLCSINAVLALI